MKRMAWRRAGIRSLVAGLLLGLPCAASADSGWVGGSFTPFQTSFAAGWSQIFKEEVPVKGVRLSVLYAVQSEVSGVDIGLFNDTETMTGVGLGLCNITRGNATGAHLGAGCNQVDDDFTGVQSGIANLIGGELSGLQMGLASSAAGGVTGAQIGLVTHSGDITGLQAGALLNDAGEMNGAALGVCNIARANSVGAQLGALCAVVSGDFKGLQTGAGNFVTGELTGAQIGAFNSADRGSGFQFGVVNYAKSMDGLQFGLLNFNENGFLPVFPFFNYGN